MRIPAIILNRGNIWIWVACSAGVLLFGMLVSTFEIWYEGYNYVSTDLAQVAGDLAQAASDPQALWIAAKVEPGSLAGIRPGQPVQVYLSDLDRVLFGWVAEVRPAPPPDASGGPPGSAAASFPIKVALDGDRTGLAPGMPAFVRIRIH